MDPDVRNALLIFVGVGVAGVGVFGVAGCIGLFNQATAPVVIAAAPEMTRAPGPRVPRHYASWRVEWGEDAVTATVHNTVVAVDGYPDVALVFECRGGELEARLDGVAPTRATAAMTLDVSGSELSGRVKGRRVGSNTILEKPHEVASWVRGAPAVWITSDGFDWGLAFKTDGSSGAIGDVLEACAT